MTYLDGPSPYGADHLKIQDRLEALQTRLEGLRARANALQSAAPGAVSGSDPTGYISVSTDGALPTRIEVAPGWRSHLPPSRLGQAVIAAAQAANTAYLARWAQAASDMTCHPANTPGLPPVIDVSPAPQTNDDIEALLARSIALRNAQLSTPAQTIGTDPRGNVQITLQTSGLTRCTVDQNWAEREDPQTITSALSDALRQACSRFQAPINQEG